MRVTDADIDRIPVGNLRVPRAEVGAVWPARLRRTGRGRRRAPRRRAGRQRVDEAGQVLAAVPGLASATAAGLARKFTDAQWHAVETGLADVAADVEVYGRTKRGVALTHRQRVGRPHVANWATPPPC